MGVKSRIFTTIGTLGGNISDVGFSISDLLRF
jgi:hypothetical protein